MKRMTIGIVLVVALGCGDDDGEPTDADMDVQVEEDASVDATIDMTLAMDAETDASFDDAVTDTTPDAMKDSDTDAEPMFSGEPPDPITLEARDGDDFELLGDNADFTNFVREGGRVQILPLAAKNFPDDVNHCTVGSDAMLNGLQQYARAEVRDDVRDWLYTVTLTTVVEEDGESEYQLVINGVVQQTVRNPETSGNLGDMDSFEHVFDQVVIRSSDNVQVRARAHSNLELAEGGGCRNWNDTYAWARARWTRLRLEAAPL